MWCLGVFPGKKLKPWPTASKTSIVKRGGSFSWLAGDPSGVACGRGARPKESDDSLQMSHLMQFSDPIESVQHIYATDTAFAALKAGGSVVAWGDKDWGGDCSKVQAPKFRPR